MPINTTRIIAPYRIQSFQHSSKSDLLESCGPSFVWPIMHPPITNTHPTTNQPIADTKYHFVYSSMARNTPEELKLVSSFNTVSISVLSFPPREATPVQLPTSISGLPSCHPIQADPHNRSQRLTYLLLH